MAGAWVFPGGALEGHESHEEAALRELEEEASLKLAGIGELVAFSRWITPAGSPVRFDTRFFLARAPKQQTARPDGHECVQADWFATHDALHANRRGTIKLVFPTIKQLEQLSCFSSVQDALGNTQNTTPTPITPKIVVSDGTQRLVLPGEPGYDEAD
jgi:8-oxo-dGTP pyrophosphatase MutT (NUDIX family)